MNRFSVAMWCVLLSCTLCLISACGSRGDTPRSRNAIMSEKEELPVLYLTEDGEEVIVPGQGNVITHNGKLAWEAMECRNPNCPGTPNGDRPFLFIWTNPLARPGVDGQVEYIEEPDETILQLLEESSEPVCPACLPGRTRDSESDAVQQQYVEWCQPYVLPATAQRLKELDDEHRRRLEYVPED